MKKIIYSLIILLSLFFASCKHEESTFDGPDLNDLFGPFEILEPVPLIESFSSLDSVDFAAGQKVYFNAKFSKRVDWKINISGLSSGAIKQFSGNGNTIDISNSTWNGSTTAFPMFKPEKCAVMLTFPTEIDTIRDTVKVISAKINAGFVVCDFNAGLPTSSQNISAYGPYIADPPTPLPATPTAFIQSGGLMDFKAKNTEMVAEGGYYYNMAGTVNWDWAIGLIEFPSSAFSLSHFPLSSNPDNVYFNVLVWGESGISNAFLQFSFREDDDGNGQFNSGSDDEAVYKIQNITWSGWKLVSIKYGDLELSSVKGNGQYSPDKIVSIRAFLLADPASGFSKTKIDYLIFTDNKALEP